jgi:proline iminopeptidase
VIHSLSLLDDFCSSTNFDVGGISGLDRRYFDPSKYHIILMDQRGSGKSLPHAHLDGNTTWDLVADLELLREKLNIEKWVVFGGSWGSTLSLTYAITHPDRVKALILRGKEQSFPNFLGIFMLRRSELLWFYQDGASHLFPDFWDEYRDHIPEGERHDFIAAYYKRLTSSDAEVRLAAAKVIGFNLQF